MNKETINAFEIFMGTSVDRNKLFDLFEEKTGVKISCNAGWELTKNTAALKDKGDPTEIEYRECRIYIIYVPDENGGKVYGHGTMPRFPVKRATREVNRFI